MHRVSRGQITLALALALALVLGLAATVLADLPAEATAAAKTAAEKTCAFCHGGTASKWAALPHGRQACTSCHALKPVHPRGITEQDLGPACQRCHLAGSGSAGPPPSGTTAAAGQWEGSKHAGVGVGCTSCHVVHSDVNDYSLKLSGNALCRSCHARVKHPADIEVEATSERNCTLCHNPHGGQGGFYKENVGGQKWRFRGKFVHYPVTQQMCSSCHEPHRTVDAGTDEDIGGGKKGLLSVPGSQACYKCHQSKKSSFERSKHAAVRQILGEQEQSPCLACHLPHASEYKGLLKYEQTKLCLSCHAEKTPHHFLAVAKVKYDRLACGDCHDPHGTEYKAFLTSEDICRKCHRQ